MTYGWGTVEKTTKNHHPYLLQFLRSMILFRPRQRITAGYLRASTSRFGLIARHSTSTRDFKVTLEGETLYIDKELAEALGWTPGLSTEGLPLRLSGWEPRYFAVTRPGTDAGQSRHTLAAIQSQSVNCEF
jgi:hypothetical protein